MEEKEIAAASPESKKVSAKQNLWYWLQALVAVLVVLVLATAFLGRMIRVVGSSMVPTLHDGDMLLIENVCYTPKSGDIVVLRKSGFMTEPIVKRVIAVAGQHVTVDYAAGKVVVDGVPLSEPYINSEPGRAPMEDKTLTNPELSVTDVTVPDGCVYVLGDNRNHSSDSRHERLGCVDSRCILGKAVVILFPFSDFSLL